MPEPIHQVSEAMITEFSVEKNKEREEVLSQGVMRSLFEDEAIVDEREEEEKEICACAAKTVIGPNYFDIARGEEMRYVLISYWKEIAVRIEEFKSLNRHSHEVSCLAAFPVF